MENIQSGSHRFSVLSQAEKNTTLWIGHLQADPTDHFGGQTFTCPSDGLLDNIQLYASAVPHAGDIRLTLHRFDTAKKSWGPPLGETSLNVNATDHQQWIRFGLPPVTLEKGVTYGFRVNCPNALIGLGEAACDNKHPFTFGHEWNGDSQNQAGRYFSYFSLAFRVEMRA